MRTEVFSELQGVLSIVGPRTCAPSVPGAWRGFPLRHGCRPRPGSSIFVEYTVLTGVAESASERQPCRQTYTEFAPAETLAVCLDRAAVQCHQALHQ